MKPRSIPPTSTATGHTVGLDVPFAYWKYVCPRACHWVVNFNLFLASAVMPKRPWRIVSSAKHSTVWDGDSVLFDMNFLAVGVPVEEAWQLAACQDDSELYPVGKPVAENGTSSYVTCRWAS